MEKKKNPNSSLLYIAIPLILYEVTFVLFVIYYSLNDISWFRMAFLFNCIALITAILKTIACYQHWERDYSVDGKKYVACLLSYVTSFVIYLFCLFLLANRSDNPGLPHNTLFVFLSIPPVMEFIIFLAIDPRKKW